MQCKIGQDLNAWKLYFASPKYLEIYQTRIIHLGKQNTGTPNTAMLSKVCYHLALGWGKSPVLDTDHSMLGSIVLV